MTNNPIPDGNKTTSIEITPLFGGAKIVLEETPKAFTPFGGLASLIAFLHQIGLPRQLQKSLPFAQPTSNNAIPPAHTLMAFVMTVVVGGKRFAHSQFRLKRFGRGAVLLSLASRAVEHQLRIVGASVAHATRMYRRHAIPWE